MLDFNTVLNLMRKYGYSSTSVHPYIYKNGNTLGICYSYVDENYGVLERVKFFDNENSLEEFLKKLDFVKNNGKKYNIRMILDNYEIVNPKNIFLRNEKVMVKGEMFNIEEFDAKVKEQQQLDEISRIILEAGNLLLVYDDLKNRQLEYYSSITKLKNEVRQKYFELQKMVDQYNGLNINREINYIPDVQDTRGINLLMETSAKDRYNQYKIHHPTIEEATSFIKDIWDLNANLETNINYYQAQVDEQKIRNEEKLVNTKIEFMQKIMSKNHSFFKKNLIKRFRRINDKCKKDSTEMSESFIQEKVKNIAKKYIYYDYLDLFNMSDYLKESINNTNYSDLAIKYSKKNGIISKTSVKLPLNEIAFNLSTQYTNKLIPQEQAALVLYNSRYRKLMDLILKIPNFQLLPINNIIDILNKENEISKIKTECYDIVKQRLNLPINLDIKNKVFATINYETYETFITSLVDELKFLKEINNKMYLNSDLNMYFYLENISDLNNKYFILVSNNLNTLLNQIKKDSDMIALTSIKENTPVLYSPYTIDFGNLYSKDNMEIKLIENTNFELLIDISDVLIIKDDNITKVVKYFSTPKTINEISVVDDIHMAGKTSFCKLSLTNNLQNQQNVVKMPESTMTTTAVQQVAASQFKDVQAQIANQPTINSVTIDNSNNCIDKINN